MSLGPGGIFPHSAFGWLMHNITVLPISLSATIRRSVRFLPLPEEGREPFFLRDVLQLRDGERPVTKGVAPHRCLEQRITATIEDEDQLAKVSADSERPSAMVKSPRSENCTMLSSCRTSPLTLSSCTSVTRACSRTTHQRSKQLMPRRCSISPRLPAHRRLFRHSTSP